LLAIQFEPAEVMKVNSMAGYIGHTDIFRALFECVRFPAASERAQEARRIVQEHLQ